MFRFDPLSLRRASILFLLFLCGNASSSTAFCAAPDENRAGQESVAEDGDNQTGPATGEARSVLPSGPPYRIGIEDVLLISVWRDQDLTREVPVRPDGKISLPLIQDVAAAGKTPAELGREIHDLLKPYLTDPSVTVIVREVNSIKVYLLGEVVRPGPVALRSRVRLLQAISMAGGLTQFGGKNGVLIYRVTPGGERVIGVSYKDIVSGRKPGENLVLEPGDTVVVR